MFEQEVAPTGSADSVESTTRIPARYTQIVPLNNNQLVTFVDTVGLFDSQLLYTDGDIMNSIAHQCSQVDLSIFANAKFLLFENLTSSSLELINLIPKLQSAFGQEIINHCLVVLSHYDMLLNDDAVDLDIEERLNAAISICQINGIPYIVSAKLNICPLQLKERVTADRNDIFSKLSIIPAISLQNLTQINSLIRSEAETLCANQQPEFMTIMVDGEIEGWVTVPEWKPTTVQQFVSQHSICTEWIKRLTNQGYYAAYITSPLVVFILNTAISCPNDWNTLRIASNLEWGIKFKKFQGAFGTSCTHGYCSECTHTKPWQATSSYFASQGYHAAYYLNTHITFFGSSFAGSKVASLAHSDAIRRDVENATISSSNWVNVRKWGKIPSKIRKQVERPRKSVEIFMAQAQKNVEERLRLALHT